MRRDDQPAVALPQRAEVVERADARRGGAREIQEQNVFAFNRALDAGNEDETAFRGVLPERLQIELVVVEGDCERVETERCRAIDQRARRVRNAVYRVV